MEDIQREEDESDAEYFRRAIEKLKIQNAESAERLREATESGERLKQEKAESEERLKQEAAESARQIYINRNKFLLMQLIAEALNEVKIFEIVVPASIVLHQDSVGEAKEIVRVFNDLSDTIEKSGSIEVDNSVHFIWSKLIRIVQKSIIPQSDGRRVVYEWGIQHPMTKAVQEIDFAFIPSKTSYLNWSNFRGGIELKINPKSSKSGSSAAGKVATDGRKQALSRAAMCVFARWTASNFVEEHRAFCCYADGRTLSVARVCFKDGEIVGETTDPIPLPGFKDCDNSHALRLLAHLLKSDEQMLSDLISAPDTLPTTIEGTSSWSEKREVWRFGEFLGFGGSGIVHCELTDPVDRYTSYVIKTLENSSDSTLWTEHKALQKLNKDSSGRLFPIAVDALLNEDTQIVALKLYPRGLTVSSFLCATGNDQNVIKSLVKAMCPVIIEALKVAHLAHLSHCDIRDSNILIVPPDSFMRKVIEAIDDPTATYDLYLSLSLETCEFILNDWGSAVSLSTTNRRVRIKSDLEMLILTVMRLGGCIDLGQSMKKPCQPVLRLGIDGNPLTTKIVSSHLRSLAATSNYEELSLELVKMFS